MISELHVSWAANQAGQLLASGTQMNEDAVVARLGNRLRQAAEILRAWVLQAGGSTIYDVTTQGAFTVPADQVHDLGRIIEQLRTYVQVDYFFGIGIGIEESHNALRQAWHTQEPYAFYDEAAGTKEKSADDPRLLEAELRDTPLEKAVNDGNDHWGPAETSTNEEQSTGGAQDPSGVASPETSEGDAAQGGPDVSAPAGDDSGASEGDDPAKQKAEAKQMVAKALLGIKAQAASLHQLKTIKPEAFEAVKNIIQALVVMAHQLGDEPESVAKAESLWKRLKLPAPKLSQKKPAAPKYPDALASPASVAGTIKDGKIKVAPVEPSNGQAKPTGWNGIRAGMVVGPSGSAVSSREPNTD